MDKVNYILGDIPRRDTTVIKVSNFLAQQVDHLIKEHKVFLLKNGRINISGLNPGNVEYVAKAINETVNKIK